jgi:signal transduction histidine kinase
MHIFAYSGLINGIFALGFGIFIISKNWRNRVNQLFFLMTLAIAVWAFGYWQWLLSNDETSALFWVRILSVGSIFIPVFYFHWILFLLEIHKQRRYLNLLRLAYLTAFFFLAFSFSPLFIKDVSPKLFFSFWPEPGFLYTFYLIFIYFGLVSYSLFLLYQSYQSSLKERKRQLFYVILGSVLGFGGGLTNFFLWYDIPIAPYGNFLVALFPFFLGYAILKHHLFNIKVVAAELLTFAIWTGVFIEVLVAKTWKERLFEFGLFVFVIIFGVLLIKSVLKLEAANKRLKQLDKLKSEFLSFASHQVKTPMTVIKGFASLIYDGTYGSVPEKVKEAAIHIKEVADQTVRLVDNFLDLRKIEEGRMEYKFTEVNIIELIKNIVEELRLMAQEKGLDLTFKTLKTNLSEIKIKADEQKLKQVIQNLIENAIKYTDKGFVKVELKEEKDSVLIIVRDSGRGISKELLPNLFQQFSRDTKIPKEIRGTGLGLYIAKEIINVHRGKIWAESKGEGKGSIFYVELPKETELPEKEVIKMAA